MSENNDKTENEDKSNTNSARSADWPSRLSRGAGNPLIRSGVLRPSALGSSMMCSSRNNAAEDKDIGNVHSNSNDVEKVNPFMRKPKDDEDEPTDSDALRGAANGENEKVDHATRTEHKSDDDECDDRPDPLSLLRRNGLERANIFAAAKYSIPRVERFGFVFGQNVHERVVGQSESSNVNAQGAVAGNTKAESPTGELLFSSVIQKAAASTEKDETAKDVTESKSLTDVAREYEESRAQKRKYEEVKTFTGEEDEVNIIDINCKLFAFVNSNWEERGRGSLRLNDSKKDLECSRVVFRTSGNLRLLLNTNIWAGMVAERPSQKSLRLTAMDNTGKIKLFLLMARPLEINQLHKALTRRIGVRKLLHPDEDRITEDVGCSGGAGDDEKNGKSPEDPEPKEETEHEPENENEDDEEGLQSTGVDSDAQQPDTMEPSPKRGAVVGASAESL